MVDNRNHPDNLEYIQELLSPYLDGEVTEEEQALVEQALAVSPELQQELEMLHCRFSERVAADVRTASLHAFRSRYQA